MHPRNSKASQKCESKMSQYSGKMRWKDLFITRCFAIKFTKTATSQPLLPEDHIKIPNSADTKATQCAPLGKPLPKKAPQISSNMRFERSASNSPVDRIDEFRAPSKMSCLNQRLVDPYLVIIIHSCMVRFLSFSLFFYIVLNEFSVSPGVSPLCP